MVVSRNGGSPILRDTWNSFSSPFNHFNPCSGRSRFPKEFTVGLYHQPGKCSARRADVGSQIQLNSNSRMPGHGRGTEFVPGENIYNYHLRSLRTTTPLVVRCNANAFVPSDEISGTRVCSPTGFWSALRNNNNNGYAGKCFFLA